MLVLTRKIGEKLMIGDSIVVTIIQVTGSNVRIGIEAPAAVSIVREELLARTDRRDALAPAG